MKNDVSATQAASVEAAKNVDDIYTYQVDAPFWESAAALDADCNSHIEHAKLLREKFIKSTDSTEARLEVLDAMYRSLNRVIFTASLYANTNPDADIREAGDQCEQKMQAVFTDLSLDRELYDAIAGLDMSAQDATAQRSVQKLLQDFKRAGVDKDEATRKKLAQLDAEILKTGQQFDRNIRDDKHSVKFTVEELEGMPEDFLASHPADAEGFITLTTDNPDYMPVSTYAKREATRKKMFVERMNIGYPGNEETLKQLIALRHEYATTLGYKSWAEYAVADKMAKTPAIVEDLINKVSEIARPFSEAELKELLAMKKKDDPKAERVETWDRFYYTNKAHAEKFSIDAQKVRTYFDYNKVRDGILDLNAKLYGVRYELNTSVKVWHESVECYDVYEGDAHIARFYLDMHPRANKYNHAAMFSMTNGREGQQLPVGSLVTNFPEGGKAMEHNDVTTFFHEFGHLMHHLLAGKQKWANLSGINCEWDFVEAPSQMAEEWAWDYDVLKNFATNDKGEVIPQEMVAQMRAADEFGKGIHVMRQMFYAALSNAYFSGDRSSEDPNDIANDIAAKYSPYPQLPGTYMYASFGHLNGYSSIYYTYMWSLMIAKDFFQKFKTDGIMNTETSMLYRKSVLERGGADDANDMVKNFLGRAYSFDALKNWLEGK